MSSESRDRREFLKQLAGAAYAAPLFISVGARGEERSQFERAKEFLNNARAMVARARQASDREARRKLAEESAEELTLARGAARSAKAEERERLAEEFRALAEEIAAVRGDR